MRTGEDHKIVRQREFDTAGQANESYAKAQQDINQYRGNVATLERGGQIGANPYRSAEYLGNVNKLQADSLDSANNATKQELLDANRRSGGANTGATIGAIAGGGLQKARLASNLSANRAVGDFDKNLAWQRYLAGTPLEGVGAERGLYGTAQGANASQLNDLTKFGQQQQAEWYKLLNQGISAAKSAASAGVGAATGGAGIGGFGEG